MITATGDKIIVVLMKANKTKGGLHLPENTQEPQAYGKVVSIGEDLNQCKNINKGDYLVFHPHAGMDMLLDRQILKVLKYDELYGILDSNEIKETLEALVFGGQSEGQQQVRTASKLIV